MGVRAKYRPDPVAERRPWAMGVVAEAEAMDDEKSAYIFLFSQALTTDGYGCHALADAIEVSQFNGRVIYSDLVRDIRGAAQRLIH